MRFFATFPLLFLFLGLSGQAEDPCRLQIGTNLAGPADWGSEWPFANIMKYSRQWISHNEAWIPGGENAWDTGVMDQIPLGEHGYPLSLPVSNIAGTEGPQVVRTVWANTEALPAGEYVLLYDGKGDLDMWGDATVINRQEGRLVVEVLPEVDIMALEIYASEAGDPVRNIRLLLPGTEATYTTNPWSEQWLEKLAPFQSLRFMDWGYTNGSLLSQWNDRPQVEDYTYTQAGVPYEWWIELCNRRQSDAWVCIPHLADENYIRRMARLFRDGLDPDLTIHVEYSNEIWNWLFSQTHYCNEQGDQSVPWPERIVPFVQNALDLWTEEFAGQEDRLVRVVGVQGAWLDVSERIVRNMRPGSFEAFAPAAYFGFPEGGVEELEQLGANATGDDVIRLARAAVRGRSFGYLREQYASLTQNMGIPMLYYEGGQHLTPEPFGSEQAYGPALVAAQSLPGMYDLYQEWYDSLRTLIPEEETGLLMNFSFIGPTSPRYGSWGLLTSQFTEDQAYAEAPKYRAILDNTAGCQTTVNTDLDAGNPGIPMEVVPNPSNGAFRLVLPDGHYDLEVYDGLGRRVLEQRDYRPGIELQGELLPPGVYHLVAINRASKSSGVTRFVIDR
jgi:hypothetical protein